MGRYIRIGTESFQQNAARCGDVIFDGPFLLRCHEPQHFGLRAELHALLQLAFQTRRCAEFFLLSNEWQRILV